MAKILVVDNEQRMCKLIRAALELDGHSVEMAFSGQRAIELIDQKKFSIVITDLKMSPVDGLQVLKHTRQVDSPPEVIIITAFATQQTAIEAMRSGAYDYLIKPFEMDELSLRVKRIVHQQQLEAENKNLKQNQRQSEMADFIGRSEKMRAVFDLINRVAASDATVLIRGESGTGKELIAAAIHKKSNRSRHKFVTINCAAVPENLLESELFGYERGAFTGANQRKIGLFESAGKGTIFLDEIGDMPITLQAKLLRVLQNKEIVRVGGTEKIDVDVRVVAATHRPLESMIEQETFRSDLFYRINIFPIVAPPLRERKEDIPALIQHMLGENQQKALTSRARQALMEYDWPGNVRELQNVLERAAIISDEIIDVQHLPELAAVGKASNSFMEIPDGGLNLEELEKNLIRAAIEKADGNKTQAAELLSITRRKLYSMMERFGLK